jgi:hypothetical protein
MGNVSQYIKDEKIPNILQKNRLTLFPSKICTSLLDGLNTSIMAQNCCPILKIQSSTDR